MATYNQINCDDADLGAIGFRVVICIVHPTAVKGIVVWRKHGKSWSVSAWQTALATSPAADGSRKVQPAAG